MLLNREYRMLAVQKCNKNIKKLFFSNFLWQSARVFSKTSITDTKLYRLFQHFFRTLNDCIEPFPMLIHPFMYLSRNEPTYINSTLFCVIDQSEKLNKEGVSVTLNSPIGQTTVEIVESQSLAQIVG